MPWIMVTEAFVNAIPASRAAMCERNTCLESSDGHLSPCFHVLAIMIAGGKICHDALDSGKCEGICKGLCQSGGISFHAVAEGVKAGVGGNRRRSSHGELGINDCYGRNNAGSEQHHLYLVHSVSDDGDSGCLGAGACCCGDCDHGSHVLFNAAAHVVCDRAAACSHDCAGLHGIDAAAAAESDHVIAAFSLVHFHCSLNHLVGGLAGDIGENSVRSIVALEHILNLCYVAELDHEGISHDESLLTKRTDGRACLCQSTFSGENLMRNQ